MAIPIPEKIKIAFFSEDFSRKGKGTALTVHNLAEQFINNFSDRVELAVIRKAGPCDHPIAKKIRNIEIKVYKAPFFSTLISYFIFFITCKEKFDVVVFNKFVYPGFWLLDSSKFILLAYDVPENAIYKEKLAVSIKLFYWFLGIVGKYFLDAWVAVSHEAKKDIIGYYRILPSKVFVMYCGVSGIFRIFSESEKEKSAPLLKEKYQIYPPYILDVSRIEPHKNISVLVDAFSIFKKQHNMPHKLVIVGDRHFGRYSKMIDDKIERLGLQEEIVIAPYVLRDDLPAIYNLASVSAFPSLLEGFGLPLVESMKCGVPVVSSKIPVIQEVVGDAALLVDPYNAQSLADSIAEVLNKEDLKTMLIEKGKVRSPFFTWEKAAAELIGIYEQLAQKS